MNGSDSFNVVFLRFLAANCVVLLQRFRCLFCVVHATFEVCCLWVFCSCLLLCCLCFSRIWYGESTHYIVVDNEEKKVMKAVSGSSNSQHCILIETRQSAISSLY